jgi:hypothetical protein
MIDHIPNTMVVRSASIPARWQRYSSRSGRKSERAESTGDIVVLRFRQHANQDNDQRAEQRFINNPIPLALTFKQQDPQHNGSADIHNAQERLIPCRSKRPIF